MSATELRATAAPDPATGPAATSFTPLAGMAWLGLLTLLGFAVFSFGLSGGYFGDDFDLVRVGPPRSVADHFLRAASGTGMYRPIDGMLLEAIQYRHGLDTRPVHLVGVATHVVLAWLVWLAGLRLGLTMTGARLASLWFLISQAAVAAVVGNDTLSQVFCALFGSIALLCLWSALHAEAREPGSPRRTALRLTSVVALTVALFSKEAALGYLLCALFLIALYRWWLPGREGAGLRAALGDALPFVAMAVVYLAMRRMAAGVPAEIGAAGYYGFRIGANIPIHLGLLLGTASLPVSSVMVFDLKTRGFYPGLAVIGVLFLAVLGLVALGIARSPARRRLIALAALAAFAVAPVLPLNHVSELYAYSALPFLALLIGAGLAVAIDRARTRFARVLAVVAVSLLLFLQFFGVHIKSALMARNGRVADRLLAAALEHARVMPQGATLWLVRSAHARPQYSVFRVEGVDLLRHGDIFIRESSGRTDLAVKLIDERDVPAATRREGDRFLIARGERLVPFGIP